MPRGHKKRPANSAFPSVKAATTGGEPQAGKPAPIDAVLNVAPTAAAPATNSPAAAPIPERQMKHWERAAWMIALIGGIHAAYTTWMSGWIYMNGRRDLILGIGQPRPLPSDLAYLVFCNDWLTCALGFSAYVALAFGLLWYLLSRYAPLQDALLNPFGAAIDENSLAQGRKKLARSTSWSVGIIVVLLAITFWMDASKTLRLIPKYCPEAFTNSPQTVVVFTSAPPVVVGISTNAPKP